MFVFLLACAPSDAEPVTLRWYQETLDCEGGQAFWDVPADAEPVAVFTRTATDDVTYWDSYVGAVRDEATINCTDDVLVTWAVGQR